MSPFRLLRLLALTFLASACLLLLAPLPATAGEASEVGIVLMHGKWGSPNRNIDQLADSLRNAGYKVSTPEMPWSLSHSYDKSFEQAMAQIDFTVAVLKANGAKRIIVAGHSLGANAALAYGAHHPGLLGVMAIAPGHTPELPDFRVRMADKLEEAKAKLASGHGDEAVTFTDLNQGRMKSITLSAAIFVSYFDPNGLANMPANAAHQSAPTLVVAGTDDRLTGLGQDYLFNRLPPDNRNRYLLVEAGHLETPTVAKGQIVEWVESIR